IVRPRRAPVLVRAIPARRTETCGPGNRPWIPSPVRQIGRKAFALVGGYQDIVGGCALCEYWQLPLDLDDAAVGPACAPSVFENLFLDNARSHSLGSPSHCLARGLVLG